MKKIKCKLLSQRRSIVNTNYCCFILGILLVGCFGMEVSAAKIFINITNASYGAVASDGNDDSVAFQSAINDLVLAGGGTLYIPEGNFHFATQVCATVDVWQVAIEGAGIDQTRLMCDNTNGVFRFYQDDRESQITLRNISFQSRETGGGIAFDTEMRPGGSKDMRTLNVESVEIKGRTSDKYFNTGIRAYAMWRPLIIDVNFSGVPTADVSDSSVAFSPVAFDVSESYAPVLADCSAEYVDTGVFFSSTNNPEGGSVYNCVFDFCRKGIYYQIDGNFEEPGLVLENNTINARDYGIQILNRRCFTISGNHFYRLSNLYVLKDIRLERAHLGSIGSNQFHDYVTNGRKNISVDGDGLDILIAGNTYVVDNPSDSIEVDPNAVGIVVFD